MKLFIKLFLLTIIDFIIIWFWVKEIDPEPSISIAIVIVVPTVILINLTIALILYFTKKEYSKVFVINSFKSFYNIVGMNNLKQFDQAMLLYYIIETYQRF